MLEQTVNQLRRSDLCVGVSPEYAVFDEHHSPASGNIGVQTMTARYVSFMCLLAELNILSYVDMLIVGQH